MFGAIIGDIIGSPYEFGDRPPWDFTPLVADQANWTDDTLMTLAVADAMMTLKGDRQNAGDAENVIAATMRHYARTYPLPRGGYGSKFLSWLFSPGQGAYGSFGNGSAMRVSSAGWLFGTLDDTLDWAAATARVTHNHPEGIAGAQAIAGAIYLLRSGVSSTSVRDWTATRFGYDLSLDLQESQAKYKPNTACSGTVPEAIIAFIESTDFETAIRNAVSYGGDTDTLAAITGSLAEAYYVIPPALHDMAIKRLGVPLATIIDRFEQSRTPCAA